MKKMWALVGCAALVSGVAAGAEVGKFSDDFSSYGFLSDGSPVCEALSNIGIKASIKWVNDVFLNGKKVCGILTERFIYDKKAYIALGIGINISTRNFPNDLETAGSINTECDKIKLAEEISEYIISYTENPDNDYILNSYRSRLFIIGKNVSYYRNNIEYSGTVIDINEHCNLILQHSDGTDITLSSGEISIII